MPGNQYNDISQVPKTRVGRLLLRQRELRELRELRRGRIPTLSDGTDGNRGLENSDHDFSRSLHGEPNSEGAAVALNEGRERPDGRPIRQRLLVVANRLPVSAVRTDEDSWSLEISAGGLVSALLGEHLVCTVLISAPCSFQFALGI